MKPETTTKVILSARRTGYSTDQITNTMTVAELIEMLEAFDENAKIYLSHDNGYTYGGITQSEFEEIELETCESCGKILNYDECQNGCQYGCCDECGAAINTETHICNHCGKQFEKRSY
jgi:hypothetical protein